MLGQKKNAPAEQALRTHDVFQNYKVTTDCIRPQLDDPPSKTPTNGQAFQSHLSLNLRWRCRVSIDSEDPRAHTSPKTIKPYLTFETELQTSGWFKFEWKKSTPNEEVLEPCFIANSRAGFSRCTLGRAHQLDCTTSYVANLWVLANLLGWQRITSLELI